MSATLDRLAAACGIVGEYQDIWGRTHTAGAATKRALLAAMGIDVASEDRLEAALAAREEASWRRVLEPVQVVREAAAVRIALSLPEARRTLGLRWVLEHEGGPREEGEIDASSLAVLERRRLTDGDHVRLAFDLPCAPGLGYHRFEIEGASGAGEPASALQLIVTPGSCHEPPAFLEGRRLWGTSAQLYALRSARSWGIGDLSDLTRLVEICAAMGADIIGLNPLHALFSRSPERASPYSPSSRVFRNPLYLDLEQIPEFAECEASLRLPGLRARIDALNRADLVDYAEVARIKLPLLERLYRRFVEHQLGQDTPRARAFREFQRRGGEALEAHGVFEALAEHLREQDSSWWGWPAWPEGFRSPDSPETSAFAAAHRERVEFFHFVQWEIDQQLEAASGRAAERGLRIGLYQDLAVSVDASGFEAWRNQAVYARGARIGCPPDEFNRKGQDWGLPPWIGDRLRETGYRPFVECLRANMRHAGALRIDHVMGLMRGFWIPPGLPPTEGAYVLYPFEDLLGVLALESRRNRCLVVGEDLGTVPDEVREALRPRGVLSYRLFYFMREAAEDFTPPSQYPEQALVAVTTHDLPTLGGFWEGRDIAARAELGLYPDGTAVEELLAQRAKDRERLATLLEREGLLAEGRSAGLAACAEIPQEIVVALYTCLARSPARILMVQLEDILGQADQINLPGTTDAYPNWRRRLPLDLESFLGDPRLGSLAAALRRERG